MTVNHCRTLWCASYPKSGNTWVRAIITALHRSQVIDINDLMGGGVRMLAPLTVLGVPLADLEPAEALQVRRLAWAHEKSREGSTIPRKTHDAYLPDVDGYPTSWQPRGALVIHVVRDPRDVAVSWAHHAGCTHAEAVAFLAAGDSAMGEGLSEGAARLGSWSSHTMSWLEQRDMPMLTLRYEDLNETPVATVCSIAAFIGHHITDAEANEIAETCRFEKLAALEIVEGFREQAAVDRPFFRRGEAGSWRRELDRALASALELEHATMMTRLGYLPDSGFHGMFG
jgi:aryl sulfotransferase